MDPIWLLAGGLVPVLLSVLVLAAVRRPGSTAASAPAAAEESGDAEAEPELQLDYEKVGSIFTPAERSFYEVLRRVVGQQYVIFGKMRMIDLLRIKAGGRDYYKAKGQVVSRHADFVLLAPQSLAPVLVIELDDASHQRTKVQESDAKKDAIYEAAGLPILHVPVKRAYQPEELAHLLARFTPLLAPEQTAREGKATIKPTRPTLPPPTPRTVSTPVDAQVRAATAAATETAPTQSASAPPPSVPAARTVESANLQPPSPASTGEVGRLPSRRDKVRR